MACSWDKVSQSGKNLRSCQVGVQLPQIYTPGEGHKEVKFTCPKPPQLVPSQAEWGFVPGEAGL